MPNQGASLSLSSNIQSSSLPDHDEPGESPAQHLDLTLRMLRALSVSFEPSSGSCAADRRPAQARFRSSSDLCTRRYTNG